MAQSGIFELLPITGGTGAVRSDDVLPIVDVHDATQAAQGSLVKITVAQLYRTETTAVTVSTPLPDIAQKWNAAGVTFTAVKLNVTDTASAAASLLIDLQVGAASKFSVRKDGLITGAAGIAITGASTITGTLGGVTTLTCTTVTATNLGGTLSTAAQPNITSVGILASPHVTTLTVDSGGLTVTAGATTVQALDAMQLSIAYAATAYVVQAEPIIYGSGGGGSAPFNAAGHLIIQARTSGAARDIIFAGGNGATVELGRFTGTGGFSVASGGITVTGASTITGAVSGITTLAIGGALSGVTTLAMSSTLTMSAAASKIVPGATSISLRNTADSADNLIITDAGAITVRGAISGVTTLTATTLAGTLSTAAQANVTSLGTLTSLTTSGTITLTAAASKIVPGATSISLRNTANSADNLLIADTGEVTVRSQLTVTAGGITVTTGGGTINGTLSMFGDIQMGSGDIKPAGGAFLLRTLAALTNGAGVAAGTLTNAPAAGNPTKWIAFDDAGTTRKIPCW